MTRVLKPFDYFEPRTLEEALRVLSTYGAKSKVLAGGVDLVDRMRRREAEPECVVSIQSIPGLDYIKGDRTQGLRIGALATLRSIELSPTIAKDYTLLWEAISQIGSVEVKNMATAVGNLCVSTPASDVATSLIALGAELKIASLAHERIVPIERFFIGVNQNILQPGEIVTEISVPRFPAGAGGAFTKLVRTATDAAKVNVSVVLTITNNTCKDVKIALGSVAPIVIRAKKAEETLKGQRGEPQIIEAAASAAAGEIKPITDIRSTAEYRGEMTRVLVRRTVERAWERAKA